MGTYNILVDELEKTLEKFLTEQEGQVEAYVLMHAWNRVARKNGWKDRILTVTAR